MIRPSMSEYPRTIYTLLVQSVLTSQPTYRHVSHIFEVLFFLKSIFLSPFLQLKSKKLRSNDGHFYEQLFKFISGSQIMYVIRSYTSENNRP